MLLNRAAWRLGCPELGHATPAKLWTLSLEDGRDKVLILTTFKGCFHRCQTDVVALTVQGTHTPSSWCIHVFGKGITTAEREGSAWGDCVTLVTWKAQRSYDLGGMELLNTESQREVT